MTLNIGISLLDILEEIPSSLANFHSFCGSWKQIKEYQMMPTRMTLCKLINGIHDGLQNQSIIRSLNPRIVMLNIRGYKNLQV